MPYCQNCGKQISDNANVCGYCGVPTGAGGNPQANANTTQQNNGGYAQPNWNNQNVNQQGYSQPNWNNQNPQGGTNQPNWNNQNPQGGVNQPNWGQQPYGQQNMYGQNPQYNQYNNQYNVNNPKAKGWEILLSILFPIVGLIFFITYKDTRPQASKTCGICALVAFIVSFGIGIISGIVLSSTTRYWHYSYSYALNIFKNFI